MNRLIKSRAIDGGPRKTERKTTRFILLIGIRDNEINAHHGCDLNTSP
jgi:hypothetical protein